jgi:hypothetical protein
VRAGRRAGLVLALGLVLAPVSVLPEEQAPLLPPPLKAPIPKAKDRGEKPPQPKPTPRFEPAPSSMDNRPSVLGLMPGARGQGKGLGGKTWGLSLAATIPHPIWLELEYLPARFFSAGLGVGGLDIPFKFNGDQAEVGVFGADIRARVHPFGGAFFLGGAAGFHTIHGEGARDIDITSGGSTVTVNTKVTARINAFYLAPHMGWMWVFKSGFSFGFDLGWLFPFFPGTTLDFSTDKVLSNTALDVLKSSSGYQSLESAVDDAGHKVGGQSIPFITLLRLSWMI